jgi:putative ABC transport system substrate-binding protein
VRRREFIALFGTATAASTVWPRRARSQRRARIGVLSSGGETASPANLEIDYRWGANDPARLVRNAEELVQSAPDVLLAAGTPALVPLHKATRTIPIVFWGVSEPVAQGFVNSLAHPGGNLTGFSNFEPSIGSKWLQLLKDVAPSVTNVTVMFNPQTSPFNAMWMRSIEAAAPAFGVIAVQGSVHNDEDIRR